MARATFFKTSAVFALFGLQVLGAHAASLTVQVTDASGQPLADAAVYAEPAAGQAVSKAAKAGEIEQKGRKFIPLVSVVQVGTAVSFPNNDTVRHQVYSFSPAKVFDIKLYSGQPANPVVFDKPGTVVLGCNIHDQMLAYVHVVPTPWFAKTDASGKAVIEGVPAGKYTLKAWHYGLPASAPISEQAANLTGGDLSASFKLNAKASPAAN